MKKQIKFMCVVSLVVLLCVLTGCTRREVHMIEANQTAFLIPLKVSTINQASFESEELLNEAKVAAKQVYITYTRERLGPMEHEWVADNMLIIVDRTPVTREWANTAEIGTSVNNQAIYAESKESIGFSVGMNCSAQIYTEQDAVKFLYSYNNKSLADIMDSEIRARVESDFVEVCAKYTMDEILREKQEIMKTVRDDVIDYFRDRGITVTVLGMKDGIEYDDPNVQTAINASFVAARNMEAQVIVNSTTVEKANAEAEARLITAQADADAIKIEAEAEANANRLISESLTPELLQMKRDERWDGHEVPVYNGITPIVTIPTD